MSIVKSFSVGDGDMFYIKHGSDNFTIIDCCMSDDNKDTIINELKSKSRNKGIKRVISTHPDDDHIRRLVDLDDEMPIVNFYCVKNEATKSDKTDDFKRYCKLRDGDKAFYLSKGCKRNWMNKITKKRRSAGLNCLWPKISNKHYKEALKAAKEGESPNDISCIVRYSINDGASFLWMGDLTKGFMENIKDEIAIDQTDILFAPHHGRDSGKVPDKWLKEMKPKIIVIGEAPSPTLNYYKGYNTITQNSAGDITFDCIGKKVHIYVSKSTYSVDFLKNEKKPNNHGGYYIGTLDVD